VARKLAGNKRGLSRSLTTYVERSAAVLAQTTTRELSRKTPKDTTFASVNWEPSVGRSTTPGALDAYPIPREVKLLLVTSELLQQQAAIAALGTFGTGYRLGQGKIYITNHVFYIRALADGYSGQAAAGWIPITIDESITKTYAIMRA
jgi:hypothetical protein